MKSSLILCLLLGVVVSTRAASVPPSIEAVTGFYNDTTITQTTTPTTSYTIVTVTGLYNDTTVTQTTIPTTPYPTVTSTPCCFTSSPYTTTTTTLTPTTQGPLTPSQMMCPDGWQVFLGRCYYFVNDGMTWPQAQSNCALLDSMLASVHSAQEYGFLQQLTNNNQNQNAWLGGFYLQDQWLWIDGSWFYNNSWSSISQESSNPCLMLSSYDAWSNSLCNYDSSSICVKESNVPPAMLCPEGWTGFQGRCYYYNSESLSWPEADANCAGLQASLVSVHSPEEYFFLYQQTSDYGYSSAWLGGFYLDNQWMWLDGSWFYQGFFTDMFEDSTSPCLGTLNKDGWSNFDCDQTLSSFCVKNAVV